MTSFVRNTAMVVAVVAVIVTGSGAGFALTDGALI